MLKAAVILSRPTRTGWDEARLVGEKVVALVAVCLAADRGVASVGDSQARVFGILVVSTPVLLAIGELVIGAHRRVRWRSAVLAQARRRIMSAHDSDGACSIGSHEPAASNPRLA